MRTFKIRYFMEILIPIVFLVFCGFDYGIYCPVSQEDRIYNYTGSQCVWSSLETLGRWVEEPKLYNLTKRQECQSLANPSSVSSVLNRLNVKFEQSYGNKDDGRRLLSKALNEGRGCLFGANGVHAMVVVHYDTTQNRVAFVDNSDPERKVQNISIMEFEKMWDGWIVIVYGDDRVLQEKTKNISVNPIYLKN